MPKLNSTSLAPSLFKQSVQPAARLGNPFAAFASAVTVELTAADVVVQDIEKLHDVDLGATGESGTLPIGCRPPLDDCR